MDAQSERKKIFCRRKVSTSFGRYIICSCFGFPRYSTWKDQWVFVSSVPLFSRFLFAKGLKMKKRRSLNKLSDPKQQNMKKRMKNSKKDQRLFVRGARRTWVEQPKLSLTKEKLILGSMRVGFPTPNILVPLELGINFFSLLSNAF